MRDAGVEAGLPLRESYRFTPHMTFLHREGTPFTRPIDPIVWRVEELVLIDNLIGSARQDLIGHWPLIGDSLPPRSEAARQYALL